MTLKLLSRLGRRPQDVRVAIQGFGNVGSHTANFLNQADCKVVAVSDVSGGYYNAQGLKIGHMLAHARHNKGSLAGYEDAERITNEELLELDVELLIPAALGGVITDDNVSRIKAPIIIEAANAPTLPAADDYLAEEGRTVLPDILANAGGVTVSYFEWAQNRQHYQWTLNRIRQELDHILSQAFESVWQLSLERKVSLRTAAFMIGIGRVGRATVLGGIT